MSLIQNKTQEIVSDLKTIEGALMTGPPIIFSLFAGSYSDNGNGRKFLLAIPFLGNILSFLTMFINLYWWEELPAQYLLLSGLAGLSGGYVCFNIGVYSYTADVSSKERRTLRMSLLNGIFSLGFVIGIQIGSTISDYWTVFFISTSMGCLGLLYTLIVIAEKPKVSVQEKKCCGHFGLSPIKENIKTALKERKEGKRTILLMLLLSFFALMLCLNTGDFDYLMTRLKFGWSSRDWGNYLTVQRVTRLVSLIIMLPVLTSLLHVSDIMIVIGGLIVTAVSYSIMCLTNLDMMMYVAAGTQMNSITSVAIRSQLSKIVESSEIGKIFAVVAVGQSLISLISHSIFGIVYRLTLAVFPTAYLIIVVSSISLAAGLVIVSHTRNPCSLK